MIMRHGHHLCSNDVKLKKKRVAWKTKQKETRGEAKSRSEKTVVEKKRKTRNGDETISKYRRFPSQTTTDSVSCDFQPNINQEPELSNPERNDADDRG